MIPNIREFICGSSLQFGCYVISVLLVLLGLLSTAGGYRCLKEWPEKYDAGYLRFTEEWCWSKIVVGVSMVIVAVLVTFGTIFGKPKARFLQVGAVVLLLIQLLFLFPYLGYYIVREKYYDIFFSVSGFGLYTYLSAVIWSYAKELKGEYR